MSNAEIVKIKVSDIDLRAIKQTVLIVEIDIFRFIKESRLSYVIVEMDLQGEKEHLEEIFVKDIPMSLDDLERMALNWIFKNVELVERNIELVK